jgi:hypothetical protein
MELFKDFGQKIEKIWRDKNYDEELFPSIAAAALKEANLPKKVSAWDVIEWAMGEIYLPPQRDLPGKFGDPPITIYISPRFHIDVYYWLEGTTSIHQHGFCGAFQVLHGSSIHSWYDFEVREKLNIFTEVGDIKLKICELLNVGDVQEILAGKQYIHGLFHLDQPSATIVVRTHLSPLHHPQYSYRKPFLAIDPFFEEPNTIKKMQCLSMLVRAKHPDLDRYISEWLEIADFHTTYHILGAAKSFYQHNQFDKIFHLETAQSRYEKIFEIVKKRHGKLADIFPPIFEQDEMVNTIVQQRSFVPDPEHRFFLALLMNVDGKERIFSLIKSRFPESEPLDKILDWTYDLANTRVFGTNLPNALGVADFDDFDSFVLENILQEKSIEEMTDELKNQYGADNFEQFAENLSAKIEKLRTASIFQPFWKL